ncbi:MAG: SDR family oxidoreductase [Sphingomonadaceae bacterium]|nr:SDR family oxidoreductase [Sphingomonadaceae bacterium]
MPTIAILGASRGIGLEFVRQYATDGWTVLASVRREEDLPMLRDLGATAYLADTTDEASLAAMAEAIGPIDVLIVNAGVGSREAKLADVDAATWTRVMTVNALGPLLAARTLGSKVRDGGKIAALSSVLGSIADNNGGMWSYRMSKAALNMGLSCLAAEMKGREIKVVALHPGWVKTEMGGEQAPVEKIDSVAGMRRVIDTLAASGSYVDYEGKAIPW